MPFSKNDAAWKFEGFLFFFFLFLLHFIDLSYLQQLLRTKRLYTTSYIGVTVIYKK